jgi:transcriptional regulator with AAA-type ATPase domain
MEERAGLIGLAEGGTLFLDEIGDMTAEVQPVFLRVLERGGEYLRLGDEAHPRKANVRVIGATNHPERLRIELRRRFHHEIVVPDLQQRTEDIPLLVNHLLRLRAREHAGALKYFCAGAPRIDPRLVEQLLRHRYSTHVSELSFLLQQAIEHSPDDVLLPIARATALTRVSLVDAAALVPLPAQSVSPPSAAPPSLRSLPSAEEAARALQTAGGCVVRTAMQLGITRHQLNRLIRKNGLAVERTSKRRAD